MYEGARVAVLVPAYNEVGQIAGVVDSMPDFVDHVVVIDDASTDGTGDLVTELAETNPRVESFRLTENQGVGGALAVGYAWARDAGVDIAVTMDGDGQMDPDDIAALIEPIVAGRADFTKGNRLTTLTDLRPIPRLRLLGNVLLSVLTKIATGYWSIADSQSGFSAAGRYALESIAWDRVYRRYGRPNDALWHASMVGCRAADVPIRSRYGIGETSTMSLPHVAPRLLWLLFRRFWRRMFLKHVLIDFHPMVFLFLYSVVAGISSVLLLPWVVYWFVTTGRFPQLATIALVVGAATSVNALFLGFWMDLHANRHISLPLQSPAGRRSRAWEPDTARTPALERRPPS
jgi:glycosyltransferase involved in cell wall biosynthesis